MSESENALVDYEKLLKDMAEASTKVERPTGASIGTRAGVLTYNGNPCAGNKLDVIVVASVHSNLFYEGKFDPDNPTNPVCFAYSEDGNNMAPHPEASKPQHENCTDCPHNKWKSDPDGGKGKACKNVRTLAVIPADTKAEELPTAEIAILRPPVTSIKNWQMYVQKVAALYNRPPLAIVTQIATVPDIKSQFKVTFTDMGVVDIGRIKGLIERVPSALEVCKKVYEPNAEPTPEEAEKANKKKKF